MHKFGKASTNTDVISTSIIANNPKLRLWNTFFSDVVGCFSLPHKNSPLQRVPEDPRLLNTKFYLFTRKNTTHPEVLLYDDEGKSLRESNFNVFKPLKVLIHGYTSKWNEKGALTVKDSYLKLVSLPLLIELNCWSKNKRKIEMFQFLYSISVYWYRNIFMPSTIRGESKLCYYNHKIEKFTVIMSVCTVLSI